MDADQSAKRCFPPVVDAQTRVLILGSLPGDASLKASQYYAHPRNAFWALLGGLIGVDLPTFPYEARLQALLARGVGLWDVIAEADRKGSLDAAIRNQTHNALSELISSLPLLQAVAFNGGTAAKLGRRQLHGLAEGVAMLDLPSSSPAYTLPLEKKSLAWADLVPYLSQKI
ncbi:DNA-deoxyinosine glycosylase [Chromobacterium sp. IIBBL 290-4]|uniref:DNA-deoxyinosine glycosylase n=1 Tax=Chromobacterium sp. IIBBL 290-4 TaxID=2953890 RepID=UPI0020B6C80D|nr:DNA-deoxyinosine glycosylase [Chromobacterium sp. IIBBL 290-4]UTH73475.1 DNA-deoxyinosine glycosylase [Chromobacterium sp. IIBBL 290-4]